ncbi:MAG: GTPase Era [Clostridia bacterium]|nr:GTPase Era [Clostridia bacterium]
MMFKCGFVAVVGKPNVGKSSLVNALVGEKIAITSPKPQTTRNKIMGIVNGKDYQVIFIDTPGEYHGKSKLAEYMIKSIETAKQGVDAVVVVLDAQKVNQADYNLLKKYETSNIPVFVVINKIDLASYEQLYPTLQKLNQFGFVKEFISTSAIKNKNVNELLEKVVSVMPEGPALYDTESLTDKNLRFMVSEIIREKILLFVQEEIPHFVGVEILQFKEQGKHISISADIICEKENHKQIIIGKSGSMIKKIGTAARQEIENLTGQKVYLELFAKTRSGWQGDESVLSDLGYNIKDI